MQQGNGKSPVVAGVLSALWCGAGQLYNGQTTKGVVLAIGYLISMLCIAFVIGLITTPILWIYGIVDAVRTARARSSIGYDEVDPSSPDTRVQPVPPPNLGVGTAATLRECCFFCSRVLPPHERHHVEVSIGGHRRVVTACHRHRNEIEGGREPLIRAEETTRGVVPWFVVPFFDPYSQYLPAYGLGIAPTLLPSAFLQSAINLSQPVGLQGWHYADDDWEPGYRSTYWDRHDRWERSQDWYDADYYPTHSPVSSTAPETSFGEAAGRAAPETSFGSGRAPEQSFGGGPTAAETAFAQSFSQGGASSSTGGGADRS